MRKLGLMMLAGWLLVAGISGCSGGNSNPAATDGSEGTTTVAQGRLKTVLDRGTLVCGVSGELPGFSFVNQAGEYAGLDVDFCRAIAAALFDDPEAVEFRNLNAKERFTALQTGEVDVLSRNTSWTISRDTTVGLQFAPVVFYDGQGVMVRQNSGIRSLQDFRGKAVCTQTGTTNEQNLADQMRKLNVNYTPVVFEDINSAYAAYAEGRCQGVTSDRSQLISRRSALPNPQEHQILDAVLSKEPLAPAVADGDDQWFDVVKWVVFSTIEAEELGITSQNLDQFANTNDPVIRRFLGQEGKFGQAIGLTDDFASRVVQHVGNYGEIYNRNLGPQTPLNLDRGDNQLWTQGGLLYAPPFR